MLAIPLVSIYPTYLPLSALPMRPARPNGLGWRRDAVHFAFVRAPATMRAKAERRAAVARFLLTIGKGLSWPELPRAGRAGL